MKKREGNKEILLFNNKNRITGLLHMTAENKEQSYYRTLLHSYILLLKYITHTYIDSDLINCCRWWLGCAVAAIWFEERVAIIVASFILVPMLWLLGLVPMCCGSSFNCKAPFFINGDGGMVHVPTQCISLNKQIDYFCTAYASMVELIGAVQAQAHLSKSLFTIIIGSNDIYAFLSNSKSTPQQFIGTLISTLQLQLLKLYNFGARKFVFVGTGPLGCTPAERSTNIYGDCKDSANNISVLYNQASAYLLQEMKSQLGDLRYSFFDTSLLLQQIIQDPIDYGFTEVKAGCCGLGKLNGEVACTPISSLCSNRKAYVFWDLYHPTEAASEIIVSNIIDGASPFVFPVNARRLSVL